jgi:hypothetical protein
MAPAQVLAPPGQEVVTQVPGQGQVRQAGCEHTWFGRQSAPERQPVVQTLAVVQPGPAGSQTRPSPQAPSLVQLVTAGEHCGGQGMVSQYTGVHWSPGQHWLESWQPGTHS